MKLIISENRIYDLSIKWLDKNFNNLDEITGDVDSNYRYFRKDGRVVMEYKIQHKRLIVSEEITDIMENVFGLNWVVAGSLIKSWFQNTYKYKVENYFAPNNNTYQTWDVYSIIED
jgi:hypothetical protein